MKYTPEHLAQAANDVIAALQDRDPRGEQLIRALCAKFRMSSQECYMRIQFLSMGVSLG